MSGAVPARLDAGVIVFHIGRSGSTVLANLLDQHPEVTWKGELLGRLLRKRGRGQGPLARGDDPLDRLARPFQRGPTPVVGAEVKPRHLRELELELHPFLERATAAGVDRFVVLRRRNLLRKVVSAAVGVQTGRYHLPAGTRLPPARIAIDPDRVAIEYTERPLLEFLEGYERDFAELDRVLAGLPTLAMTYEDDVELDPFVGYRRLCEFLGLEPLPVEIRNERVNPWPIREIVEDVAPLEQALAGTRFAWMLDG
jgi:hypothetical protein